MEKQEVVQRNTKEEDATEGRKVDIWENKSDSDVEEDQIFGNVELRNVDDALEKIKGNNRFTWLYAAPIGLIYAFSPVYLIPYMKQIPTVEWSFNGGITYSSWSKDYACSNHSNLNYKYDYNSLNTVDNWITKIDLIWITDFQIGLLGTLFFLGWMVGAATLLSLGDIIGRKKVLIISIVGLILMLLGLIIVDKLWLLYINLFFLGIFQGSKGSLAYLYMLELAPINLRPILHMYIIINKILIHYKYFFIYILILKLYFKNNNYLSSTNYYDINHFLEFIISCFIL